MKPSYSTKTCLFGIQRACCITISNIISVGAVHYFTDKIEIPNFSKNYTVKYNMPKTVNKLSNGRQYVIKEGPTHCTIDGTFGVYGQKNIQKIMPIIESGEIFGLSMVDPSHPHANWPVIVSADNITETFSSHIYSEYKVTFTEVI